MHNEFDNRSSGKLMSGFEKQNSTQTGKDSSLQSSPQSLGPSSSQNSLQTKVSEIETAQTFLASQMEEVVKTFKLRMDRMQLHLTKLEQQVGGLNLDWSQKIHQIHVKVNEQKKYDQKVQELMDRHANLIKSYEVRIQHLTKIMNEKEAQVVQAHAALNEAKMEIARLKRI